MLSGSWGVDLVEGEHLLFCVVGGGRCGCGRCTRTSGRSGIHADGGIRDGGDYITLKAGWNGSKVVLGGRADAEGLTSVNGWILEMCCWTEDLPTCTEVEAAFDGCGGAMVGGVRDDERTGLDDVRGVKEGVVEQRTELPPVSHLLGWAA